MTRTQIALIVVFMAVQWRETRSGTHSEAHSSAEDNAPIKIRSAKRVFWDDSLILARRHIRFEMHRPHRTGEKCLVANQPWESWQIGGMMSLLHENGTFRLWYGVSHGVRHGEEYAVAYAESKDGKAWTKPNLELVEYAGSRQNNLVVGYSSVIGQVFVDPHAAVSEKYKMLVAVYPVRDSDPKRYLTILSSPDGLRWSKPDRSVVREGNFALDTQSQAFWDRDRQAYVLYTRMGPWRQVGRSESQDAFSFPAPEKVMQPDDPIKANYYQAGVTKYEEAANAYFALVPIFFHPGDAQGQPVDGNPLLTFKYRNNPVHAVAPDTLDIHLFTSSDSVHWRRHGDHVPFLGLGPDGEFDSRSLYPEVGYAVVGSEIWLYYSAFDCTHIQSLDGKEPFAKYLGTITRATLRLDGFVSATAGHDIAELVTKPLEFSGRQLELNVDCSAGGYLNVELQNDKGAPIASFGLQDSDRVYHNNVRKVISWNGRSDVSSLAGTAIRVRFVMRDCRLYSLRFAP